MQRNSFQGYAWGSSIKTSCENRIFSSCILPSRRLVMAPYFLRNLVRNKEQRQQTLSLFRVLRSLTGIQWAQFFVGYVVFINIYLAPPSSTSLPTRSTFFSSTFFLIRLNHSLKFQLAGMDLRFHRFVFPVFRCWQSGPVHCERV